MNQSRFKFGDCVIDKGTKKKFYVFAIASSGSGFYSYRDEYYKSLFIRESDLELYQEPQRKKLYAFRDKEDGEIRFYEEEITRYKSGPRVPEYDIEYPESK